MNWFYDTIAHNPSDLIVKLDRIYCFLFDSFSDEDWSKIDEVYANLPGSRYDDDVPFWYGPEGAPAYLYASVEPPGLQVTGILPITDWLAWDSAFRQQIEQTSLPRYEVDY